MCLKIYELDFVKFLSAPGLASVAALKKTWKRFKKLYVINGKKL